MTIYVDKNWFCHLMTNYVNFCHWVTDPKDLTTIFIHAGAT
jgi:hypothetical protein